MIPVYICDDNLVELDHVKDIIEKYLLMEDLDMKVVFAGTDPDRLLTRLESYPERSMYFIDIDYKRQDINGFLLAQKIRSLDARGFIVIISSHEEMTLSTFQYGIEAMDYIVKGQDIKLFDRRIVRALQNAYNLYNTPVKEQKRIKFKIHGSIIAVNMDDICCFESSSDGTHRIMIIKKDGTTMDIRSSLSEIEEQINGEEMFFRCHKSCIVNIKYISEIDSKNYNIILDNGHMCPVAIRTFKRFLRYYLSH